MQSSKPKILVALGVAVGLIAILIWLYSRANTGQQSTIEVESAKSVINALGAVIIGGVVMEILKNLESERQAEQQARITRRALLRTDIIEGTARLYTNVKRVRRLARANVINNHIAKNKYDEWLVALNDDQLDFERYKRAAQIGARVGWLDGATADALEAMEKYLGNLITEYEQNANHADLASANIALDQLSAFTDFIAKSRASRFHSEFVSPYHIVLELATQGWVESPKMGQKRYTRKI